MTIATTTYLWLSVLVWGSSCVTAVRFNDHMHVRVFRAFMAIWPAGLLAGGAL